MSSTESITTTASSLATTGSTERALWRGGPAYSTSHWSSAKTAITCTKEDSSHFESKCSSYGHISFYFNLKVFFAFYFL